MIKVIDNAFNFLGNIDEFDSFMFTRSFYGVGRFELRLFYDSKYQGILEKENIIFTEPTKAYVILFKEYDSEDHTLTVKGVEVKGYLSRRITKPPENEGYHRVNDNIETIMKAYVEANAGFPNLTIAPDLKRGSKVVFQTRYKQLDEELEKVGLFGGIGWGIGLDLDSKQFVFDVIEGKDRTVEQSENANAIFSMEFDNIKNQELIESKLDYKNVAYVAGQGEGKDRAIDIVNRDNEAVTGFDRYEVFIDARDIENEEDLEDRGRQKLSEMDEVFAFESRIESESNLIYQEDFDIGDIVTVRNKDWNVTLNAVIKDITEIYEGDGFKLEATFGNTLPTAMEMIKKKLDDPIYEGGGGGSGLVNMDGGLPNSVYGGLDSLDGGGIVGN